MSLSRSIARILGPSLIAIGLTEGAHMEIFRGEAAAVVYFNGIVLVVAGLAIVQAHNRWSWDWPVLVTLSGWTLLAGGLYRMVAPTAPQPGAGLATDAVFAVLVLAGAVLSYEGYRPENR